jgi:capsular polysaccharide transport system permease protein
MRYVSPIVAKRTVFIMFDLKPYILLLWKKRWFLFVNAVLAGTLAVVFAFFIARMEYCSEATFLPPFGSSGSLLSMMGGNSVLGMLSSGDESGDNIEAVFDSKRLKRKVIEKFNLYDNYKLQKSVNKFELAVKQMQKQVLLSTTMKGKGIGMSKTVSYSIRCYHTSPDTALQMAEFVFASVDSAIREVSIDKAQRSRIFVEKQIAVQNKKMDSLQMIFLEFQNTNKAYDIPEQAKLSLKMYADIKASAIMNELRLASLKNEFSGSTHEMLELKRSQRVYDAKLREYEMGDDPNIMPSLDKTSRLFPEYTKMLRDIEVQNQIILFLTKEYEQARLQEVRDVSPLLLIDPPYEAEYKSRPKRIKIIVAITVGYMLFLAFIIITRKLFSDFKMDFLALKPDN